MAKRPYIKLYVDDFFGSFKVQGMTTEQIGAYFLMLMAASQEPNIDLLDDDIYLGSITRLGKKFKNHSAVLKNCFDSENGMIYNAKLRKVLAEYDNFVERQRVKSAKGVEARQSTGNPRVTQAQPTGNPTNNHNHNQEPSKEIDTKVSIKKVRVMIDDVRAVVEQALPKLIFTEKFTQASKEYFAEWSLTGKKLTDLKTKVDIGKYMQKQIGYLHKKYSPSQIEFILERCSRLEWVGLNDDDKVPEPKPLAVEVPQEIYSNLPIVPKTTLEDIDTLPDIFKTND